MTIAATDLTVVLQGALPTGAAKLQALNQRIQGLRQLLPGVTVVISTWNCAKAPPKIAADHTVYSADPGSLPPYKLGACKPNNVNRQIVSSAAGLAVVRTPFAIKLRNDAALLHTGALAALAHWPAAHRRIATVGHFSLNPHQFERLPFHFSDWFQLGPTHSLRALWACPLMTPQQATHYDSQPWAAHSNVLERRFRARWPAEQHVWRHYAAQLGYAVPQFHNDNAAAVLAAHDQFLAHELLLLDLPQAGLQLPALAWAGRSGLQRFNCLQHIDWLAAAAQAGQFVPSAAQRALIQRRCRAQRLVQWAFQATQPLRPLLLRPPLKIVGRWVLKAADAWSRPAAGAPTGENAGPPAPPSSAESASSLNPSHPTPC